MSEATPDQEMSGRMAQTITMAVQLAELGLRLHSERAREEATSTRARAAQLRGEQFAEHAADRVVYARANDREWVKAASVDDLGQAWGHGARWADTDRMADTAVRRAEARLREMAPETMKEYDQRRAEGLSRVDAMRHVAVDLHTEVTTRAAGTTPDYAAAARAQDHADTHSRWARADEARPDNPATPSRDEHQEGQAAAFTERSTAASWDATATAARSAAAPTAPEPPSTPSFPRVVATNFPTGPGAGSGVKVITGTVIASSTMPPPTTQQGRGR